MQPLNLNESLVALTKLIESYNHAKKKFDQVGQDCVKTANTLLNVLHHRVTNGQISHADTTTSVIYSQLQEDFHLNTNGKTMRKHLLKLAEASIIDLIGQDELNLSYMMQRPVNFKFNKQFLIR